MLLQRVREKCIGLALCGQFGAYTTVSDVAKRFGNFEKTFHCLIFALECAKREPMISYCGKR